VNQFRKIAMDVEQDVANIKLVSTDTIPSEPKPQNDSLEKPRKASIFSKISSEIHLALGGETPNERDPEWQRVNSAIADVFKDSGVLFSKLARLQGDFAGSERAQLEEIGNEVRDLTDKLSKFSSDFYNGDLNMKASQTPFNYGGPAPGGGGAPQGGGAPPPAPAPPAPSPESNPAAPPIPTHDDEDFDVEAEISDEDSSLDEEYDGGDKDKDEDKE
jgi:hypothetical protein